MIDRECSTATGAPKRRYDTRAQANAVIRRHRLLELIEALAAARQAPTACKPYRCGSCGYFHIGHYPENPATRQKLRRRHHRGAA